jgi:hypothetical protein
MNAAQGEAVPVDPIWTEMPQIGHSTPPCTIEFFNLSFINLACRRVKSEGSHGYELDMREEEHDNDDQSV